MLARITIYYLLYSQISLYDSNLLFRNMYPTSTSLGLLPHNEAVACLIKLL